MKALLVISSILLMEVWIANFFYCIAHRHDLDQFNHHCFTCWIERKRK